MSDLKLYELINPSDPYTFYAPSIEIAGVCAYLLSSGFGAGLVGSEERSPVMFGWDEWFKDRGIDANWVNDHRNEIANAYESFLIGGPDRRADIESMLAMLPEEKRKQWRDERQNRERSSLAQIGEVAYRRAEYFRHGGTPMQTTEAIGGDA